MYRYEIEVTNTALLTTTQFVDIQVDESPPESGVVFEGSDDFADIDFTSDTHINVRWHGFIDHESGVAMYTVALAPTCITQDKMAAFETLTEDAQVINTTLTSAQFAVTDPGKYFVTVLAFNRAMEPSRAVCSDGFSKVNSLPRLKDVTLLNSKTTEHTVCYNRDVWLITDTLTRQNVTGMSPCVHPCLDTTGAYDVTVLPEKHVYDTLDTCSPAQLKYVYLPTDTIRLSWTFQNDDTPIDAVYVGFGSNKLSADSPDLQDFEQLVHQTSFRRHHLGFNTGTEFYIFIKSVNKAGLYTTIPFGPVVIDESPPVCPTTVTTRQNETHVILDLDENTFTDEEQREDISSILYRISKYSLHNPPYH